MKSKIKYIPHTYQEKYGCIRKQIFYQIMVFLSILDLNYAIMERVSRFVQVARDATVVA